MKMKYIIDLDRKSQVEETLLKQQLTKQAKDAQTQSEISFLILGQSIIIVHIIVNNSTHAYVMYYLMLVRSAL